MLGPISYSEEDALETQKQMIEALNARTRADKKRLLPSEKRLRPLLGIEPGQEPLIQIQRQRDFDHGKFSEP